MDTHVSHPGVAQEHQTFCDDVLSGLSQPQKELPCKYFYDEHGSKLFDKICRLDEYYPTRTEMALLGSNGEEIADLIGPGVCLIEYGCGSLDKTRLLIDALDRPSLFVPIDISEDHLINSARALAEDYQELDVRPLVADFTQTLDLPQEVEEGSTKRVGFFPGSTIGNFDHQAAEIFLRTVFETIGEGGGLLIGVDMKKNEETLIRAYDDAEGVTAAFNLNVIERCSGHGGAWGVKKDNFEVGIKIGKPVARQAVKASVAGAKYLVSECPLARDHIVQGIAKLGEEIPDLGENKHPIELLAAAYGY